MNEIFFNRFSDVTGRYQRSAARTSGLVTEVKHKAVFKIRFPKLMLRLSVQLKPSGASPPPVRQGSAETCILVCFFSHAFHNKAVGCFRLGRSRAFQIHGAVTARGWTTRNVGRTSQFRNPEDRRASSSVSMWWALWWVAGRTDTFLGWTVNVSLASIIQTKRLNEFHVYKI